jgi:tetraprenyl-beta-curcumene synthase
LASGDGSRARFRLWRFNSNGAIDPTPLSPRQLWALAAAAARELLWGLRAVAREVGYWKRRAAAIPDAPLREDGLDALTHKRDNIDGAAFLWILTRRRDARLLRLLVRYETMADFLDSADERAASAGVPSGRCLQQALADAIDPQTPRRNYYYERHPWRDDGGYLRALVDACRNGCASLPAYAWVRPSVIRAAEFAGVQALNHESDPSRRAALLRAWAVREPPHMMEASWFELTAAASAWLTVLALLSLAAEPAYAERDYAEAINAYFWISMTAAMLDSYADMAEDIVDAGHSYVTHYGDEVLATRRIRELVRRSMTEARALRNGPRQAVIAASMVALYLSKDSAQASHRRAQTRSLVGAGGSLTRLLLPILRAWRTMYGLRST